MSYRALALLIGLAAICMGCSTAYRSEVSYQPVGGDKYNLAVKVLKIEKSPISGVKELPVYAAPSHIWEYGKPQSATATLGQEGSDVRIDSFFPKRDDSDATCTVSVRKKGEVIYESKFIIKQQKR